MILLGVAPCTAMVFVWSQLVLGTSNFLELAVVVAIQQFSQSLAPLRYLRQVAWRLSD